MTFEPWTTTSVAALAEDVVRPWLSDADVDCRSPGWVAQGREGSVTATGDGVLVVEGVGAARHELAELASYVVWVNTDPALAREEVAEFHAWWMGL